MNEKWTAGKGWGKPYVEAFAKGGVGYTGFELHGLIKGEGEYWFLVDLGPDSSSSE